MQLTEEKVIKLYEEFKGKAETYYKSGNLSLSMKYWENATRTAYSFYFDELDLVIEEGLRRFADVITKRESPSYCSNRCVFYDTNSTNLGALTQQYVRAIFAAGWEMLYVTEKTPDYKPFWPILEELQAHSDKVTVKYVPQKLKGQERLQFIYDTIINWGADKLFMHIYPWSVYAIASFSALPSSITRYNINHSDHVYWAGTKCLDYNFEFRKYGCNLSFHGRGIDPSKLFLLPFYPIETETSFEGFPFDRDGCVVIFSGGFYYKTFDENDTYMKICKSLLDIDHRVRIVYAGFGDDSGFKNLVKKYGLSERFYMLGFRKDISSIFENCDFYLNTYPVSGGLMCSFAAHHGVPIFAYYDGKNVKPESIVCQIGEVEISSLSIDSLCDKARLLIEDDDRRKSYGEAIKACSISPEQFNEGFMYAVSNLKTPYSFTLDPNFKKPPLDLAGKIRFENTSKFYHKGTLKVFGFWRTLCHYPGIAVDTLLARAHTLLGKIKKKA